MDANNVIGIQRSWGWKVATHLYLAGMGAGLYVIGFLMDVLRPASDFAFTAKLSVYAAATVLIAGLLLIYSHLGNRVNAVHALSLAVPSWLARGSIALIILLILDLIQIGMPNLNSVLGIVTSLVALFVLVYTGMLLTSLKPFQFWHTWLLPFLFVFSGMGSGFMLLGFLIALYGLLNGSMVTPSLMPVVSCIVLAILWAALMLIFFLGRAYAVASAKDSFRIMTTGSGAMAFWLGVVIVGHLIPLFLGIYLSSAVLNPRVTLVLSVFVTLCGIIGGLLLKYLVLSAGTSAKLKVAGDSVPLPKGARFPASHRVQYR